MIDKETILMRLGGDVELFAEIAAMYVEDSAGYAQALEEALAAGDFVRVQREAHTIKGLLATFTDDAGTAMALAVEQLAGQEDTGALGDAVGQLLARVRLLAEVLKQNPG